MKAMGTNPDITDGHAILADRVFDGHRWHVEAAVLVRDGRILEVGPQTKVPAGWQQRCLPAGTFLAAGFIDLQVNGGGGVLLNDRPSPETLRAIARAHWRYGTTGCLPTLISGTREQIRAAIEAGRSAAGGDGIIGLHVEGPFINPRRAGVHPADRIAKPTVSDLETLLGLGGVGYSMVTLAPECVPDGFIRALTTAGVRVSIGHSEASATVVTQAIADGATGVTHLYNAMPPLSAREPGIVGMALTDDRLTAGLIADGIHVNPISIRAAFAAKGCDRIALITDAMSTVGATIDHFVLGSQTIKLTNGKLSTDQGTLAGAHLDMASAVRNTVRLAEIPLEDALRAASLTPARFLGLEAERGAIVPGARADLVALTQELTVFAVWIDGAIGEVATGPPP